MQGADGADITVFGKGSTADVLLEHGSISREHAVILNDAEKGFVLIDLDSTHRTRINNTPVRPLEAVPLVPGSVVQVRVFLLYRFYIGYHIGII